MALVAIAITKRTLYQGREEEFDNVYHVETDTIQAGDENYRRVVDLIVAAEKQVHSDSVEFMTGRVWSTGRSIAENVTLGLYDLDGFGVMGTGVLLHAEAAILISWECDRVNALGRKVYMRKFLRPQILPQGTADAARGKTMMPAFDLARFKTYADAVDSLQPVVGSPEWNLTTGSGRVQRAANNGVVSPYVITREFRRN